MTTVNRETNTASPINGPKTNEFANTLRVVAHLREHDQARLFHMVIGWLSAKCATSPAEEELRAFIAKQVQEVAA